MVCYIQTRLVLWRCIVDAIVHPQLQAPVEQPPGNHLTCHSR